MGEEPTWLLREWVDEAHSRALRTHGGLPGNGIEVHLDDVKAELYTQRAARCTEAKREKVEMSIAFWLNMASREND